jgi:methionyl aminopeptidase
VFTIEPFLSMGGQMADQMYEDDEWTLIGRAVGALRSV